MSSIVPPGQVPPAVRDAIARIVAYNRADEERDYAECGPAPGQNSRQGHICEDLVLVSHWLDGDNETQAQPGAARQQPPGGPAGLIRVRVVWSEVVTSEAARDLDAARICRLGYDPQDPRSIARYLCDADSFDGGDWYPWHSEFSEHARRIDADSPEITSVTIEP